MINKQMKSVSMRVLILVIVLLNTGNLYSQRVFNKRLADNAKAFNIYRVREGDSILKIAKLHRISPNYLRKINDLTIDQNIFVDQKLNVPYRKINPNNYGIHVASRNNNKLADLGNRLFNRNKNYKSHVVQPGETAYSIARIYKTSINNIKQINNLNDKYFVFSGQILRIPLNTSQSPTLYNNTDKESEVEKGINPSKYKVYIVKKGDTLLKISRVYNLQLNTIANFNGIQTLDNILIGQKIKIPILNSNYQSDIRNNNNEITPIIKYDPSKVDNTLAKNNWQINNASSKLNLSKYNRGKSVIKYIYYRVRPNDSMVSIANKFNLRTDDIRRANNMNFDKGLTINQHIRIPQIVNR